MEKINLAQKFSLFSDCWSPKIVAELNGQQVKLAKFMGAFPWHRHESEDELFLVIRGSVKIEPRERTVTLEQGELLVVPRGVEHRPSSEEESQVLLFEPISTLNTGDFRSELTIDQPDRL